MCVHVMAYVCACHGLCVCMSWLMCVHVVANYVCACLAYSTRYSWLLVASLGGRSVLPDKRTILGEKWEHTNCTISPLAC